MPLVQVTMLTGRTADQKRKLAQRLTDAMVEEAGGGCGGFQRSFEGELRFGRGVDGGQEIESARESPASTRAN
jgi:Tautomerase enzyme